MDSVGRECLVSRARSDGCLERQAFLGPGPDASARSVRCSGSSSGRASPGGEANSAAPISDRVSTLEEQLRRVEQRVQDQIDDARRGAAELIEKERARLDSIETDLREKIRELATGGLRLESRGLAAIVLGTILATLPSGTARAARVLLPI